MYCRSSVFQGGSNLLRPSSSFKCSKFLSFIISFQIIATACKTAGYYNIWVQCRRCFNRWILQYLCLVCSLLQQLDTTISVFCVFTAPEQLDTTISVLSVFTAPIAGYYNICVQCVLCSSSWILQYLCFVCSLCCDWKYQITTSNRYQ